MTNQERRVRHDSDHLLDELNELKRLEEIKRQEEISSPPFHELAEDVSAQAKRVFEVAVHEEALGDSTERSGVTTEEVRR